MRFYLYAWKMKFVRLNKLIKLTHRSEITFADNWALKLSVYPISSLNRLCQLTRQVGITSNITDAQYCFTSSSFATDFHDDDDYSSNLTFTKLIETHKRLK